MKQIFDFDLNKIPKLSKKETLERKKNLKLFMETGLPSKKDENWKFSDFNSIISKNFKNISNNIDFQFEQKIQLINDFDHNFITLVNGNLKNFNLKFEDKEKVHIKRLNSLDNFNYQSRNILTNLNRALSFGGYSLDIEDNYKCKKPIVIYSCYSNTLENKIINNSNQINLGKNSELTLIEYSMGGKTKFVKNTSEKVTIAKDAIFKSISIQKNKCNGYFYKNIFGSQSHNSIYQNFILSSGLRFNKVDIEFNLEKESCNCFILSGLCIGEDEQQEIKTRINHLAPNCKSYQKIKKVLEKNGIGVYQGKIYVNKIAQKTDAYQLSKALILNDKSEFNAKPELEIYADDVKCSHGSTSGSIDKDAIHYLMTRGIDISNAKRLLIKGFINEIFENISEKDIKVFLENNIEEQVNEIK